MKVLMLVILFLLCVVLVIDIGNARLGPEHDSLLKLEKWIKRKWKT